MDLSQIEAFLDSPNPQSRMKAITALRNYEPDAVVPLLKRRANDKEFVIRSFVVMGLGYKRNEEGFEALLEVIEYETDPNVVAEAANSLSKFGSQSLPSLVTLFEQNNHWLVRQSILATLDDFDCLEVILKLCRLGCNGEDLVVRRGAISHLIRLEGTALEAEALEILCRAAADSNAYIRTGAARALRHFDGEQAKAALAELRQDPDHRVIGAVLEGLL